MLWEVFWKSIGQVFVKVVKEKVFIVVVNLFQLIDGCFKVGYCWCFVVQLIVLVKIMIFKIGILLYVVLVGADCCCGGQCIQFLVGVLIDNGM